ncbi:hypothetical protein ABZ876_08335 [Streptomyces sp. NPDC046931]|uniref:hypothetical protein n=1 Tax=Streptomyces sp. NPDC046931 TaxID=3154806 RepID=UPI0034027456
MIRESRFLISRQPYAVDLNSLNGTLKATMTTPVYVGTIDAVWFRRRKGAVVACIGQLWDFQSVEPADAAEFLARLTDGRTGGRCHGRWNGRSYWAEDGHREEREGHLAILRPMLADYPALPDGYDGWWTFHGGTR